MTRTVPRQAPAAAAVRGAASRIDRHLGRGLRGAVARDPRAGAAVAAAGRVMAPLFRGVVVALIARRATRRAGVEALVAAVSAAGVARLLRDRIGRGRPGTRSESGFPSRHAAAATAIARAVADHHPRAGTALGAAAAVGMAGRVQTADHDPADLVAGAALGWGISRVLAMAWRFLLGRHPARR